MKVYLTKMKMKKIKLKLWMGKGWLVGTLKRRLVRGRKWCWVIGLSLSLFLSLSHRHCFLRFKFKYIYEYCFLYYVSRYMEMEELTILFWGLMMGRALGLLGPNQQFHNDFLFLVIMGLFHAELPTKVKQQSSPTKVKKQNCANYDFDPLKTIKCYFYLVEIN